MKTFTISDVTMSGFEDCTHERIDKVIEFLKKFKEKECISEREHGTYLFRANFIIMIVDYLIKNKVKLRENYLSNVVDELPDDYTRCKYLLDNDNFFKILFCLNTEVLGHVEYVPVICAQDEKSGEILRDIKRKI